MDFWPAINAYFQIITWALLTEYHFQIVCMLTLLHGGKVRNGSQVFESLRAWIHICEAECKAIHRNRKWTEQHIRQNCSKQRATVVIFYYYSPPLVTFVQLCSDQGFATTSGSMLRLRMAPCLWTKPKLKKTEHFCFDCIIWTSVVPAGAL